MPVYEYECSACKHQFEEWQKITDAPVRVCPQCNEEKVERLISQTSFHLKGGGWYSDLYSSSKKAAAGGGGGGGESGKSEKKAPTDAGGTKKESPAPAPAPTPKKDSGGGGGGGGGGSK